MTQIVIGVVGPGEQATPKQQAMAYTLGQAIAQVGWVLLTGGRNIGIMDAASQGAQASGGLTLGILPDRDGARMSSAVDIPIFTGLGDARNAILVLSSRVVVVCGLGPGTASEVALALKARQPLVFLQPTPETLAFWQGLSSTPLVSAPTVPETIAQIQAWLALEGH